MTERNEQANPVRDALIVIDVQQGFDDPKWGARNNPACESNVAALIDIWRAAGLPVVFVRHDSTEEGSPLRPELPGNAFKAQLTGEPDLLIRKSVHSAFHGSPDLDAWLRGQGTSAVTICGITTNHCCETTTRVACDLGYDVRFVVDATCAFDTVDLDGAPISADELTRATAASLQDEFAQVVRTADLLGAGGLRG